MHMMTYQSFSSRNTRGVTKGALVWRTGLSGVPPDSVQCTRAKQLWTPQLRVSQTSLRYNSPDCPVHQRSNDYFAQCSPAKAEFQMNSAQTVRGRAAQPSEAHQTVNSTCPVRHRTVRCHKKTKLQRSNPNGWVTWLAQRTVSGGAPKSVRWRTGLSGAPIGSSHPNGWIGGWGL
jgi:hypothetical protein